MPFDKDWHFSQVGKRTLLQRRFQKNLNDVKIIDCSWHMPNVERNGHKEYLESHIKNAIFFDLDKNSDQNTDLPHMLANNNDWEDICFDSSYIYIADFGNNYGNRQDLVIYKVSIPDYLNTSDNTVVAEQINFSYSDQTTFQSNPYNSNFDAESIISFNDSLYIFTKNWVDNKSNVYSLTKNVGTYIASKVDSLDVQGLITAAEYNHAGICFCLAGAHAGCIVFTEKSTGDWLENYLCSIPFRLDM